MKKLLISLGLLFTSFPTIADELDTARENVRQYFISDEEPKVKDAVWTGAFTFKVGVIDDGTKRDGYAQYICLVLDEKGFKDKGVLVQVIDIQKLIKTDKWVSLGKATCK